MLMIRLQRVGRKHEPVFRLVLTDSKNGPKSGKFLEILGNYDARRGEKAEFKAEKIKHWISNGAKLSDTVHNILIEKKIIEGKKINVLPKKKPIISEKVEAEAKKEMPIVEKVETEETIQNAEIAAETKEEVIAEPEKEKSTEEVVV